MAQKAKLSYFRTAPRKVRLVADLIRGKKAKDAQIILNFTMNKSAAVLLKLLNQAMASAKNNLKIDEDNLYISEITVDGGPMLKRFRPRARGSAYEIQKKTSHITITLKEINPSTSTAATQKISKKAAKIEQKKQQDEALEKESESLEEQKEAKKQQKPKMVPGKDFAKSQIKKTKRQIFRRQTF